MGEAAPHAAGGAYIGKAERRLAVLCMPHPVGGSTFSLQALLKILGLMALKWPNGKTYLWGRDREAGWFVFVFAEGGRDFLVTSSDLTGLEAHLNEVLAIGSGRALTW